MPPLPGQTGGGKADNNGGSRRGRFNDWLPLARISPWPGALTAPPKEAADMLAVCPRCRPSLPIILCRAFAADAFIDGGRI